MNTGINQLSRRRFLAGTVATAGGLVLAGCAGDENGESNVGGGDPSANGPSGSAMPSGAGTGNQGGTLVVAQSADAQPGAVLAGNAGNSAWRHQVFDALTVLDSSTGLPRPVLARDWELRDGGRTIVLQLREGVTFHSGRPFAADDAVFTLEQVLVPENGSQARPIVAQLTGIEATGSHELTLTSDAPMGARIFDAFELAVIVDRESFGGLGDGSEVIGTGPFRWQEWEPGAALRLERNETYWSDEQPLLDAVEFSVISDSTALSAALGERVQLTAGLVPRDAVQFQDRPGYNLVEAAGGGIIPLGMDVQQAPFDRKDVRQAIGYAIDRERIIEQIFNGIGDASDLWWRSNEPGTTDDLRTQYHYDPERARQMIDDAGVAGTEVEITVLEHPAAQAVFEIVQFDLKAVGLEPVGNVLATAEFDERQLAGDLGPMFIQIHGLQGFSAATLVDVLPALRDGNPSGFETDTYRQLKDALQQADEEAYPAALADLATMMLDEAFSHVLVHTAPTAVHTSELNGLDFTNVGYLLLAEAWLDA